MRKPSEITVKVMPPGDGAGGTIRTYRIPTWRILLGRYSPFVALALVGVIGAQAYLSFSRVRDVDALREENVRLRARIESVDEQVAGLSRVVQRVQQFDVRLRKVTMLSDPERNLAMGPIGGPETDRARATAARATASLKRDLLGDDDASRAVELIEDRVDVLGHDARDAEDSVRSLQLYLEDQQALLAMTPSLKPVRGWRTSSFGFRTDPYTGLRQMHAGMDIAADIGREVIAPGDGLVTFAGVQGAYGNVVILDHGQGLVSLYGHLSEIHVKVGDELSRGMVLGKVGNTGRSTGPHLHYEIRVNGVPQNPERFILE